MERPATACLPQISQTLDMTQTSIGRAGRARNFYKLYEYSTAPTACKRKPRLLVVGLWRLPQVLWGMGVACSAERLIAAQGGGRGLSLGFTAIARLRRKGWPCAPQTASYLSSVLGGKEEGAGAGPWQWGRGSVCLLVSPSSPARGQGVLPKHSLALLLGERDPGPRGRPQPRGEDVSGTGRVAPNNPAGQA